MQPPDSRNRLRDRQDRWRDAVQPQLGWAIVIAAFALPGAEVLMRRDPDYHPHFQIEAAPAFSVWFSLLAIAALLAIAWLWCRLFGDPGEHDGN